MVGIEERISRMSPVARGLTVLAAITIVMFVIGFWVGFGAGAIERGQLPRKPLAWVIVAIAAVATVAAVQFLRALFKTGLFAGLNRFDTRYWKMWLWIALLGIPIGIGMVLLGIMDTPAGDLERLFGTGTIGPVTASLATILLAATLGLAAWLYHRAIDDHEERAYLWGSQFAYYFVSLAIPAWWLLSRGGIVPPLEFAAAFSIILVSFVIQAAVWAWFKFR